MSKKLEDYGTDFEQNPVRTIRKFILWLIAIGIVIGIITWVVNIASVPGKIIEKTLDPDNVIQNYEWFKQQYQDWNAINSKCVDADSSVARFKREAGDRIAWTFEDKNEYSRLTSISDGLKYQRADIASKYNARSEMMNRELFKTNDLPESLPQ